MVTGATFRMNCVDRMELLGLILKSKTSEIGSQPKRMSKYKLYKEN